MARQKLTKEEIRFQIDQLRKDKMIYALESIAMTFIFELAYILITVIFELQSKVFAAVALSIPFAYYLFMSIGNLMRLNRIKKLEKEL